jgi:hypothetical protein
MTSVAAGLPKERTALNDSALEYLLSHAAQHSPIARRPARLSIELKQVLPHQSPDD